MGDNDSAGRLEKIYDEESIALADRWRRVHFRIMLLLSAAIVAVELAVSLVLLTGGGVITSSVPLYFWRYLLLPALTYAAVDFLAWCVKHFLRLDGHSLNYVVSLAFVALCCALCFFHSYFVAVYASGVAAIALTAMYGDQRLTGATTATLIACELLIVLTGSWDADVVRDETYMLNLVIILLIELASYVICVMHVQWEERRRRVVVMHQFETDNWRRTAERDQLTGIRNRLGLRQYIDTHPDALIYAMMDIDRFKSVNDRWGHAAGDRILADFGELLSKRESDTLSAFRYGGDEFLLVFSGCDSLTAHAVCRDIRGAFSALLTQEMRDAGIGISFGLSVSGGASPSEAIRSADSALYDVKHGKT